MTTETPSPVKFDKILAVWTRRKWPAIICFAAALSVTTSLTTFAPNIYESAATLLVVGQQVPAEFVRSTVTGALDARLQAINQELLSRDRLENLIQRFDLYPQLRKNGVPPEALLERVRRDIDVRWTRVDRGGGTIAFTVKYQGTHPDTVALVANMLASSYIEENTKIRESQATGTAMFLRAQLDEVKTRLEAQEHRVSQFKHRYLGELPTQLEANLATLERLNTQFRLNSERQMRAREQRQDRARTLETFALREAAHPSVPGLVMPAVPGVAPAPIAIPTPTDPNLVRLDRLRRDLENLRSRFNDKYPDVVQLKIEIAALEREIAATRRESAPPDNTTAREPKTAAAPDAPPAAPIRVVAPPPPIDPYVVQLRDTLSQLDVELRALREEEIHLRTQMATYQSRVDNTPRRDQEFQELSRDHDSTRELYRTLLKRYEEAQLSESLEQRQKGEQFRILESAVPHPVPIAPNRPRLFAIALMLSFGCAVAVVLVAEQLDTSFHSLDELRAFTNLPVLATIPRIVTRADIRHRRRRVGLTTVVTVSCLVLIVCGSYYLANGNEQLLRILMLGRS